MKEHPMDDTEDAVRRLFAVAAEDAPPGIDLLRGVRARNRRRTVRIRSLVAVGATVIAAAAVAITVSAVQAPSASAQVMQAAERTAAQSYQVSATSTVLKTPVPGAGLRPPQTVSGAFDPTRGIGEETNSQGLQTRYVGGYVYVPVTGALRTALNHSPIGPIPAGKSWLRLPGPAQSGPSGAAEELTLLGSIAMGANQVDPQNLLSLLESATQVREVGAASGPGWTGSGYAFTVSTTLPGPLHSGVSVSGTVGVDQQGRVRQFDAVESIAGIEVKVAIAFGDFGLPVSVSAPPASQTFSLPTPAP
jgi:opacity protein-like surface antigen